MSMLLFSLALLRAGVCIGSSYATSLPYGVLTTIPCTSRDRFNGSRDELKEIQDRTRCAIKTLDYHKKDSPRFQIRKGVKIRTISEAFNIFELNNIKIEDPLKELAMAWSLLNESRDEVNLSIIPLKQVDSPNEPPIRENKNTMTRDASNPVETKSLHNQLYYKKDCSCDTQKAVIDTVTHFKMHRTDSPNFMVCEHDRYEWWNRERGFFDFHGQGKQITVRKEFVGGRPIIEIYGSQRKY
ncbi:hypothetical protein AOQ84DRAFT_380065 [Glonium stellatum]|uniref:Uncharacterized protein n=1 Tax=Glonium stellatum TaxID=574774 RepID=A0A8E2EU92_9PEZI|nr:hypothetical protein AOQ84DRAFT_380065 [Glonium stellatum]